MICTAAAWAPQYLAMADFAVATMVGMSGV